jgi:hypothetical protein
MRSPWIPLSIASLLLLGGCVSSSRARKVTPTGFLGESASLLKKGGSDEALLVYKNKGTDWKTYDKIVLDPVTLWGVESSNLTPEDLADYQELVNSFFGTLKEKLSKDYTIVEAPTPGALRMQVAIINGKPATATLKVVKTVAPYAGYADTLWAFVTGKPAFAGEASIEGMIRDSESQELLAAWADRRVGGNQLGEATVSDWGDVENILTYYSDYVRYLLCVQRKAKDCKKPSSGLVENPLM